MPRLAVPAVVLTPVLGAVVAAHGGYHPPVWGWSSLVLLWVSALALVFRQTLVPTWPEMWMLGGLGGTALLQAVSSGWSNAPGVALLESERTLLYMSAALALIATARRGSLVSIEAALLAVNALACAWALSVRLLPDAHSSATMISSQRLGDPFGYSNALGIAAAAAIVLALGLATAAERPPLRAIAAGLVPMLALTLYFTYSRGGWLSLGAGVAALGLLHPHRARVAGALAATVPASALLLGITATSAVLTHRGWSARSDLQIEGERVLLLLVACSLISAALGAGIPAAAALLERLPAPALRAGRGAAIGLPVAVLAVLVVQAGSPGGLVDEAARQFGTTAPDQPGSRAETQLNPRLFSLSATHRNELWRVAWSGFERHPVLGSGAGTFERGWLQLRPVALKVRDGHSLWLERLYELGIVGALLAAAAFAPAVVVGVRLRGVRHVPTAFAAVAALLVHQSFDWDWEMPALTLILVALCAGILAAGRRPAPGRGLRWPGRAVALAMVAAIALACGFGFRVNLAVSESSSAALDRDGRGALAAATLATDRAPWLAEGWQSRGEANLLLGRYRAAAADFRQALKRDDGDWELWYGLAKARPLDRRAHASGMARKLDPLEPRLAILPG
jgi:hypothetical protein